MMKQTTSVKYSTNQMQQGFFPPSSTRLRKKQTQTQCMSDSFPQPESTPSQISFAATGSNLEQPDLSLLERFVPHEHDFVVFLPA